MSISYDIHYYFVIRAEITMPNSLPFYQVDVFTHEAFSGNPLAVVFDADNLTTEQMQHITRWTNLSEAVFFQTPMHPEADYKVRIFTVNRELPFAGHPTLGSCFAWLQHNGKVKRDNTIIQECGAGLVKIKQTEQGLAFAAPPIIKSGDVSPAELGSICRILNISQKDVKASQWIDNGPGWVGVLLESAEKVLSLKPETSPEDIFDIGVIGAYPEDSECDFELRAFFDASEGRSDLREDPVTGSLNASMAQWLISSELASKQYSASQGTKLLRKGRIYLEQDATEQVWVGGEVQMRVQGVIDITLL